jgi:hypothetical protein
VNEGIGRTSIKDTATGFSAAFAHPIETIKAKLQLQFSLDALKDKSLSASGAPSSIGQTRSYSTVIPRELYRERYTGPIDVVKQTVKVQGVTGMWKGFAASLWFRSNFAVSKKERFIKCHLPNL